jgi:ribosomal protein S18 acetylase RimI-like enzyme
LKTEDGAAVGFLTALVAVEAGRRVATIDLVGVDSGRQRSGVGSALVAAFAAHYGGCDLLRVGTQAANLPSLGFYERLGFTIQQTAYVLHRHVIA